ncbi:uncharacterized protein LOC119306144 [Triticum dicoccoides]|uniref:uncharacterized protein LOC119306144 n=1 Tax=Triticum dicoccoides TaxID=85692 RepID=UPI00188F1159|nr:uncharacterized protein LOC119306144 [Triticum dicoccoides]XP_037438352.1 uncharacterized protein LOC119306144 [Triticum dicoccoides]
MRQHRHSARRMGKAVHLCCSSSETGVQLSWAARAARPACACSSLADHSTLQNILAGWWREMWFGARVGAVCGHTTMSATTPGSPPLQPSHFPPLLVPMVATTLCSSEKVFFFRFGRRCSSTGVHLGSCSLCGHAARLAISCSSLDAFQVLPASVAPERVSVVPGGSGSAMKQDDGKWKAATKQYKALLPALGSDKVLNVMDMSTVYGGLAASLVKDPVCVMNVVSSYGPNSLGVVYDRGLIGTNPRITSSPNCILLAVRCLAFPLLELN